METCFIAMPISTPAALVEQYDNDADHFEHVLDHLFRPAIEGVGLKPVSPVTAGSSVIHAEMIKQLTDAQLVLCDMSTLNANVFFELGVRTALDRPVCLVIDHHTANSPFDLSLVNHHKYHPSMAPWVLKNEVPRLQDHLRATLDGGEHNAMWSVVSLARKAEVRTDPNDPAAARLELLENQVRLLTQSLSGGRLGPRTVGPAAVPLRNKRILWVDDVPGNNFSEINQLEALGAMLTLATSTKEAVDVLRHQNFHLVLSDIHRVEDGVVQNTAGFQLLTMLREELGIYTPVIFYTSGARRAAEETVVRKYRAGVTESPSELIDLVLAQLRDV